MPFRWIATGATVALLGAGAAIGLAGPAAAATLTVGCGGTYSTIGAAVTAASSGDTIQVCAGTYDENVTDGTKKLTFDGPNAGVSAADGSARAPEAIVDGGGNTAFTLSDGSTVDGFRIVGATTGTQTTAVFANADGATVNNSILDGNDADIIVTANSFTASGDLFQNPVQLGSGVFFNSGGGSDSSVTASKFVGDFENSAINVADPDHSHIATDLEVQNNTADLTAGGNFVVVGGTSGLIVDSNTVAGSGSSGSGIRLLGDDTDFTIDGNYVHDFGAASAINLNGGSFGYLPDGSGTIDQNRLQNNTRGINIADGSGTIEVHYNVLTGNSVNDPPNATPPNAAINNATVTNTVNAQDNFFGCNTGPNTSGCDAVIDASVQASQPSMTTTTPWLVLGSTIGTHTLTSGQTTTFTANLNHDNLGATVSTPVLDGTPIAFDALGQVTVNPGGGGLNAGIATTTVKAKSIANGSTATGQVNGIVVNAVTTQNLTIHGLPTPKPSLTIHDASTAAGKSGTHTLYFPVTLNHKYTKVVTVKFATANGTAKSPANYLAKSGTVTFPVGATSERIGITIKGSNAGGANKSFFVTIYSPTNATVADPDGTGIIRYS